MDLLRRYSNRADLVARLQEVRGLIGEQDFHESQFTSLINVPARPVRTWRVRDRLTGDDLQVLIADFLAGTSKRELAERYEVSFSTVKNILRQHGVRRTS